MRDNTLRVYYPEDSPSGQRKRSSHPTQPGSRSTGYRKRRKKPKTILHRAVRFFKRWKWGRIAILAAAALAVIFVLCQLVTPGNTDETTAADTTPAAAGEEPAETAPTYTFRDGNGYPIDVEHMTDAWAAEAGFEKRYTITDAERLEIAQVITAEAVGEPFAGKVAVAQCILQACEDDRIRPGEVLEKYEYSARRPTPDDEALEAVEAVFDFGIVATTEPIKYFYAPELTESGWHESQVYVMTINNHKFFKEADQ